MSRPNEDDIARQVRRNMRAEEAEQAAAERRERIEAQEREAAD